MNNLDDLIRTYAGRRSAVWIAAQGNVSARTVRRRAKALGISVVQCVYAKPDKQTYHVRPPAEKRAEFAKMLNDLMDELELRSQNAALCAAVEQAHEWLGGGWLQSPGGCATHELEAAP